MKYILAGGTGRLGRVLSAALAADGHSVICCHAVRVFRRRTAACTRWLGPTASGAWAKELSGADGIINRERTWPEDLDTSTPELPAAVGALDPKPGASHAASRASARVVLQAAVGCYGVAGHHSPTEESPAGDDFLPDGHRLGSGGRADRRLRHQTGRPTVRCHWRRGCALKMALPFKPSSAVTGSGRQYCQDSHR
jgi:NAD dependent epimerase/dehydratase family enzyme